MKIDFPNKPVIAVLIIVVVTVIAYSNTFQVPFYFDDETSITQNPVIKDIRYFLFPTRDHQQQLQLMKEYEGIKSRYVGYLTFSLNYWVHGLDVTGYHVVNLLIHIVNALLVYVLVMLSFKTPSLIRSSFKGYASLCALFAALLFASHPLQTQAVTYIVQRLASLATLFYLLSLVLYIKSRLSTRRAIRFTLYALSLISAVSAMKTKQIAFTLPVIIILYEFMFFRLNIKKRILYLIPLLLTMLIIPLSLINLEGPVGDFIGDVSEKTQISHDMSRWEYLMTQFRVLVTYIRLVFLPVQQNLDYEYPIYRSFSDPNVFISFLFLLLLSGIALYLLYRSSRLYARSRAADHGIRLVPFGIFWFFITLSVESTLIPLLVIYEHRMYLPSAGVFIAISVSVFIVTEKLKRRWKHIDRLVLGTLALIIVVLTGATVKRNTVWQDKVRFWGDIVSKSPGKVRVHMNLGYALAQQGEFKSAIMEYRKALALPDDGSVERVEVLRNLGAALIQLGLYDDAIRTCREALQIAPLNADVLNFLAISLMETGQYEEAISNAEIAIRVKQRNGSAYNTLGELYLRKKEYERAFAYFVEAIRINPDIPLRYYNTALSLEKLGRIQEACSYWESYLRLEKEESSRQEMTTHMKELGCDP